MFDFLKKKITNFVSSIVKREEEKQPEKVEEKKPEEKIEEKPIEKIEEKKPEPIVQPASAAEKEIPELPKAVEIKQIEPKPHEPAHHAKPTHHETVQSPKPEIKPEPKQEHKPAPFVSGLEEKPKPIQPPKVESKEEKTFAPKMGFFKQLTSILSTFIQLEEKEINPALEDLELSLLESDASLETTEFIIANLRKQMAGQKVEKKKLGEFVNQCIHHTLVELLSNSAPRQSFFSLLSQHKTSGTGPFTVLFVGPNGAGKTTTIAKIASQLKEKHFSVVIAAADTFRAAAIQQAEHHGEKIGVRVIKHDYGADPAAVAFDAIAHAKANNVDVVLIDTAGRQETNQNLIGEMQKLNRVVKPNLKLFVGESLAGHSVIEQVKKFHSAITLEGIILSKLDCDAKGGNALSIANDTKLPIYFVGLGQEYGDLVEFTPQVLLSRILAAS